MNQYASPTNMFLHYWRWFSPVIKATKIRSKILLAAKLSVAGTCTIDEMRDTLLVAGKQLTEPRSEDETDFLESLSSRILIETTLATPLCMGELLLQQVLDKGVNDGIG